jgi:hypothetical protein
VILSTTFGEDHSVKPAAWSFRAVRPMPGALDPGVLLIPSVAV